MSPIAMLASTAFQMMNKAQVARKKYQRQVALNTQSQAWQKMMSDTAHQRQVKDLLAAGLNPMLSAKLGGATSPAISPGSAPQGEATDLSKAASTALQLQTMQTQADNMKKQGKLLDAKTEDTEASAKLKEEKSKWEINYWTAQKLEKENKKLIYEVDRSEEALKFDKVKYAYEVWKMNWFRHTLKAPKEVLVAKVQNFAWSRALSDMPEETWKRFNKTVNDAFKFALDQADKIRDNPDKFFNQMKDFLETTLGTATGVLAFNLMMQYLKPGGGKPTIPTDTKSLNPLKNIGKNLLKKVR